MRALCLLLAACGAVPDPTLDEDFEAIASGFARAGGGDLRELLGDVTYVVDDEACAQRAEETGRKVGGFYKHELRLVRMVSRDTAREWGVNAYYRTAFAHELGHALGLAHADEGLMTPAYPFNCEDREGACLAEALRYAAQQEM
jgi:hypothetical protein